MSVHEYHEVFEETFEALTQCNDRIDKLINHISHNGFNQDTRPELIKIKETIKEVAFECLEYSDPDVVEPPGEDFTNVEFWIVGFIFGSLGFTLGVLAMTFA